MTGLGRAPRADRGVVQFPGELRQLIEGLALRKPPPSIAAVHRQAVAVAQREGWRVPSYSTVYAIIHTLDPGLVTLAHAGAKAYRLAFDLLYHREAATPNALWQADHTLLDLWVRDESGVPVRPWLTVILDDYSRAVAAYRLSLSAPTALHTALTLRDAIGRKSNPCREHRIGSEVQKRAPDIEITLSAGEEEEGGEHVHGDVKQGDPEHGAASDRWRGKQAMDRFPGNPAHRGEKEHGVNQGGENRGATPAIGATRSRRAQCQQARALCQCETQHITRVMHGVADKREGMRPRAKHDLKDDVDRVERDANGERTPEVSRCVTMAVAVIVRHLGPPARCVEFP